MYFDTLLKTSAPDKQPNSHIFSLIIIPKMGIKGVKDLTQFSFEGFQYSPHYKTILPFLCFANRSKVRRHKL